jgi:hypothetical protein
VTVAPASAVPLKVGVVTLVMLSVDELPESEAAVRSGVDGAAGGTVSTITLSCDAVGVAPALPLASVAFAAKYLVPSDGTVQASVPLVALVVRLPHCV